MATPKRNALGKGLSALLKDADNTPGNFLPPRMLSGVNEILISQIEANPWQPRSNFDLIALDELAESIKVHGIIQPITVRKMAPDRYQLISGERRTKAAVLANLTKIPAYIRIADDQNVLEMALIENIQREDLNPIEIALSYQRLMAECSLKQDELSERVGKSRTAVSNYLRLLKLPVEIQIALREGRISMGQARAIINIDNEKSQMELFNKMESQKLSVRDVEQLAREVKVDKGKNDTKGITHLWHEHQSKLRNHLNLDVRIKAKGAGNGELVLPFRSEAELLHIINLLEND